MPPGRFGKSTHISMISNSVTHLRSYTNSAIAKNSVPISQVLRTIADVTASSADAFASSAHVVASNDLRAIAVPSADVSSSSAGIVASND